MRAKPTTTYRLASPRTWELIRAAYLSGMSAPALAARFGVSVGAIRKRAGRDGWTKRAYAQSLDGQGLAPAPTHAPAYGHAPARADAPAPAYAHESPPGDPWAELAAALPPLRVSPEGLARRSLGEAARALGEGRLDDARKLVATCQSIVRLQGAVDLQEQYEDDPFEVDAGMSPLRRAMFALAVDLSDRLATGKPMPPDYAEFHAELMASRAAEGAAEE